MENHICESSHVLILTNQNDSEIAELY